MTGLPPDGAVVIQIPGYSILGQIGRGGMATVYRARQTLLDREVALKVMSTQLAQDPVYAQRFLQEARMLAALNHPHIVPVYDVGVTPEGLHYFSMQLLGGGDFAARMREGISELELIRVLVAVAHALGFAHARGYVHRDVSPANILFDAHDTPILTDFGIARAVTATSRITQSGLSIGTSHYMSPEQARGAEVDHRSDLYSLGVLCYEAVVGTPPFEGEDGFAVAFAHVHDPVPRLPPEAARWQPLIDRAMAKDPAERFPDAGAFIEGLREVAPDEFQALGPTVVSAQTRRVLTPPPKPLRVRWRVPSGVRRAVRALLPARRRPEDGDRASVSRRLGWPLIAIGVAAVLLLATSAWLALRGGESPVAPVADHEPEPIRPTAMPTPSAPASPSPVAAGAPSTLPAADGSAMPTEASAPDEAALVAAGPDDGAVDAAVAEPATVIDPVQTLIALGRKNISMLRLTTPPETNALDRFKTALAIEPDNAEAAQGIADVAQAYLDLAGHKDPPAETGDWLDLLARAERVAGEHPAAAAKAEAARAARRAFVTTQVAAGQAAIAAWQPTRAAAAFDRALQADPDNAPARAGRAEAERVGTVGWRFHDPVGRAAGPDMVVVTAQLALGRSEVTVGQFKRYWQAAGQARFGNALPKCRDRDKLMLFGSGRSRTWQAPDIGQTDAHPVVCVSQAIAAAYAAWLAEQTGAGYRLPKASELQQFIAAPDSACHSNLRDAAYRKVFGGRDGVACDDGHSATAPVGSYAETPPGLVDTVGNVREWSADCGSSCAQHVVIGLGWDGAPGDPIRAALDADEASNSLGFRLARELPARDGADD